jgi:hypothetical protein
VALAGIYLAYRLYVLSSESLVALGPAESGPPCFSGYYVDELYDATIINPAVAASTRLLWKKADAV